MERFFALLAVLVIGILIIALIGFLTTMGEARERWKLLLFLVGVGIAPSALILGLAGFISERNRPKVEAWEKWREQVLPKVLSVYSGNGNVLNSHFVHTPFVVVRFNEKGRPEIEWWDADRPEKANSVVILSKTVRGHMTGLVWKPSNFPVVVMTGTLSATVVDLATLTVTARNSRSCRWVPAKDFGINERQAWDEARAELRRWLISLPADNEGQQSAQRAAGTPGR